MKTVFLEKDSITKEFLSHNIYEAWIGFKDLKYNCQPFYKQDLNSLPLSKDTIVCGSINTVYKAFDIIGCKKPLQNSIPEELFKFTNRKIWKSTLGKVREDDTICFIKPLKDHKLFTGHVRGHMYYLMETSSLPNNTEILCSEIVDFETEWRGFVLNKKLIGLKNYKGDFSKIPDTKIINQAISEFTQAPIAYSIDVALYNDQTVLVEVNDVFALGYYGLSSDRYVAMIEARWNEITGANL